MTLFPRYRAVGTALMLPIGGLWLLYVALVAVRLWLIEIPHRGALLERHLATALAGAALTVLFLLVLRGGAARGAGWRIAAAAVLAPVPACLLALVNYDVMFVWDPAELWSAHQRATMSLSVVAAQTVVENYFLFLAAALLAAAIESAAAASEAARRVAAAEANARAAQLRALHYQLNPHFIFNALNTISALVLRGDPVAAERVIVSLSEFLRATLTLDPVQDLALGDEVRLQRLYLAVEQIRFGERLDVDVVVPPSLELIPVPALLLQPLIENVIRHAVGRVASRVTLTIRAKETAGSLHIDVEDDAPGVSTARGIGIGLENVRARLETRYGSHGRCNWGPRCGGGFRVALSLPMAAGDAA